MQRVRHHVPCALAACLLLCVRPAAARPRKGEPLRFSGRFQVLSGAGLALPQDYAGRRALAAYVPLDVEFALRLSGPLSLSLGGVGYSAPFESPACPGAGAGRRANAMASFIGLRLDWNNSLDGPWLNPWLALRAGVAGQDGVPQLVGGACAERPALGTWLGPRAGLDLWLGRAAATFSAGYDLLPRASAVVLQAGLTLRLF